MLNYRSKFLIIVNSYNRPQKLFLKVQTFHATESRRRAILILSSKLGKYGLDTVYTPWRPSLQARVNLHATTTTRSMRERQLHERYRHATPNDDGETYYHNTVNKKKGSQIFLRRTFKNHCCDYFGTNCRYIVKKK